MVFHSLSERSHTSDLRVRVPQVICFTNPTFYQCLIIQYILRRNLLLWDDEMNRWIVMNEQGSSGGIRVDFLRSKGGGRGLDGFLLLNGMRMIAIWWVGRRRRNEEQVGKTSINEVRLVQRRPDFGWTPQQRQQQRPQLFVLTLSNQICNRTAGSMFGKEF